MISPAGPRASLVGALSFFVHVAPVLLDFPIPCGKTLSAILLLSIVFRFSRFLDCLKIRNDQHAAFDHNTVNYTVLYSIQLFNLALHYVSSMLHSVGHRQFSVPEKTSSTDK